MGLNSSLLLNLPVDDRGLIHENETKQLALLADFIQKMKASDKVGSAKITTSSTRNGSTPEAMIEGVSTSFWAAEDDDAQPQLTLMWETPQQANTFVIQEHLPLGQRIKSFELELLTEQGWSKVYSGSTVGNKRMIPFESAPILGARFTITSTKATPVISNLAVYNAPFIPKKS